MATDTVVYPDSWKPSESYNPSNNFTKIERVNRQTGEKTTNDYLTVQQRLCWFTSDQRALIIAGVAKTTYTIQTDIIEIDRTQGFAFSKTYIRDVLGNEVTAFGSCLRSSFPDFIEKSNTKSLGRALGQLGYNTASAQEFDEGEDAPVDAPQESTTRQKPRQTVSNNAAAAPRQQSAQAKIKPETRAATNTAPTANAGALATDRQLTSIRKLCTALNRPEPDLATLTFGVARELLTELSHAYSAQRHGAAEAETHQTQTTTTAPATPQAQTTTNQQTNTSDLLTLTMRKRIDELCEMLGESVPADIETWSRGKAGAFINDRKERVKQAEQAQATHPAASDEPSDMSLDEITAFCEPFDIPIGTVTLYREKHPDVKTNRQMLNILTNNVTEFTNIFCGAHGIRTKTRDAYMKDKSISYARLSERIKTNPLDMANELKNFQIELNAAKAQPVGSSK
jgi:hypothetical protein